jgi:hypothetical protein
MNGEFGLLAAVSRIAAILPNDLAPTNMNGPNRTLAAPYNAAVQLSHCGHSCMAQHFCRLIPSAEITDLSVPNLSSRLM